MKPTTRRVPGGVGPGPSKSTDDASVTPNSTPRPQVEVDVKLTKAERAELASIVRLRARTAKSDVEARAAELRADFEAQLATEYDFRDEDWADVTAEAERLIREADAVIAAKCRDRGIPEKFRPGLNVNWYRRGENALKERRVELRKVATTRIEALARDAKRHIEREELEARSALAATAMTTEAASRWLDSISQPSELMPTFRLGELTEGER